MNALTVFFDVGGTLLDSPDLFETIANNLTNKGSDEKTRDLVLEIFMKLYKYPEGYNRFLSIEDLIATTLTLLAKEYGYPHIFNRTHDIYFDVFLHQSSLFPETLYILDTLHENSVRMIIASDTDTGIMGEQLVKHNLKKYFVDVCTSELVQAYKPSNNFVSYLKGYTSNNEENCYFVGDSREDIECGKKLSIKSVLVDRKNLGNKVDADYIIHDLKELLPVLNLK